jgi:lipase (class 3)
MGSTVRTISEAEVRKVAAPLWLLINQTQWPGTVGQFDLIKNGASAIVAHLAYCAIGADEKEHRIRAKVVPCRVYQELLRGADFDFIDFMRSSDFVGVEVVRTKFFVAIILPVREMLLIGVRGTQFAYDWMIKLKIARGKDRLGEHFHVGFLREAERLADELFSRIRSRQAIATKTLAVYFAGHSLGGAVAAVMANWTVVEACYMFGAPRITNSKLGKWQWPPFATRRYLDIVPHCPPRVFGYVDFTDQKAANGGPFMPASGLEMYFFATWLFDLAVFQFPKNHSMERYRLEVLEAVKQDPRIKSYWNHPDIAA